MLVEGVGQLLACRFKVLFEGESFEHEGVPFILHELHESGDGCGCGWSGFEGGVGFDRHEVFFAEFFFGDGACSGDSEVLFNEAFLKDMPRFERYNGVDRWGPGN